MENPYRNTILKIFDQLSTGLNYEFLGFDLKPIARKELIKGLQSMTEQQAKDIIIIVNTRTSEVLNIA